MRELRESAAPEQGRILSIERLEAALAEYPGALVIATHDDAFAARCTDTTWELRGRRIFVSGRDDAATR